MENSPFGPASFESSNEGGDKPTKETKKDKKKLPLFEAPPVDVQKEKAGTEIARSIDKLPLFEAPSEKVEKSAEAAEIDELSTEETQHIQQETAREHLAAIEQTDSETAEELELASKFLQKVEAGEDPDEAFTDVATEFGVSEEELTALAADPEAAAEAVDDEVSEELDEVAVEQGVINTDQEQEGEVGLRGAGGSTTGGRRGTATPPPRPPLFGGATPPPQGGGPAAVPAAANTLPARANTYYQNRYSGGDLLIIGLVGYLIGRRRGRIKTEKKLLPTQRKLEKQVKKLEADITHKEQQLVAIKAEKQPPKAVKAPMERMQPSRAAETRLTVEKPAERLGHMIIAAEAPKTQAEKPKNIRQAVNAEHVQTMSRAELLEVSEKIIVEGASLRRIYESNLIGEKQLRHVVREYLQGKDIRKDLRREMVEHEIDFERDPMLRDRVRSKLATNEGGALSDMLAKAGVTNDKPDPAFEKRVKDEAARELAKRDQARRQRVVADTAMVTAIVLLVAVVAFLIIR